MLLSLMQLTKYIRTLKEVAFSEPHRIFTNKKIIYLLFKLVSFSISGVSRGLFFFRTNHKRGASNDMLFLGEDLYIGAYKLVVQVFHPSKNRPSKFFMFGCCENFKKTKKKTRSCEPQNNNVSLFPDRFGTRALVTPANYNNKMHHVRHC